MGLTYATVALRTFTGSGTAYEALFLVDIGATNTMAPAVELRRIGVAEEG